MAASLVKYFDQRFEALKTVRSNYEGEWKDINDFILPHRGRFSTSEKDTPRRNRKIYDGTATYSCRTLAAGLMAGITSPARPWFKLGVPDQDMMGNAAVKVWLELVEDRMMHVLAQSNFYNVLQNLYAELGAFGTACLLCYEDNEDVVRFYNPTIGEYYIWTDDRGAVCGVAHELEMSVGAMVKRFGKEKLTAATKQLAEKGFIDKTVKVRHIIDLNEEFQPGIFGVKGKPYRSVWWEQGSDTGDVLAKEGFNGKPFACPRWNVIGLDTYGRGAGSDVIGDVISLQAMTKKKARAVDKQIDPAMNLPGSMKSQGSQYSLDPSTINFIDGMGQGVTASPAQTVNPQLQYFVQDIQEIQTRIKTGLYENLFLMISEMDRANITATEIIERKAEKLIALGPVVERLNDELLSPVIDRVFDIMQSVVMPDGGSFLPSPPQELIGVPLKIEFISMFRQAQQQEDVTKTVTYVQNLGLMAQVTQDPSVLDNLDTDEAAQILGNSGGVPARVIMSKEKKAQVRAGRAQAQQQAQNMQNGMAAVQAAKELGNTPITQDQNALQRLMAGMGNASSLAS